MIGASNRERTVALAILEEEQRLRAAGEGEGSNYWAERIAGITRIANFQVDLTEGTARYNDQLRVQADLLAQIDDHARSAADGLSEAFHGLSGEMGRIADSMGKVLTSMTGYQSRLAEIALAERKMRDEGRLTAEQQGFFARDRAQAEVQAYGDIVKATKSAFAEKTAAYPRRPPEAMRPICSSPAPTDFSAPYPHSERKRISSPPTSTCRSRRSRTWSPAPAIPASRRPRSRSAPAPSL